MIQDGSRNCASSRPDSEDVVNVLEAFDLTVLDNSWLHMSDVATQQLVENVGSHAALFSLQRACFGGMIDVSSKTFQNGKEQKSAMSPRL
jgi:hypothetical protein